VVRDQIVGEWPDNLDVTTCAGLGALSDLARDEYAIHGDPATETDDFAYEPDARR
jgi:hypothetical protein